MARLAIPVNSGAPVNAVYVITVALKVSSQGKVSGRSPQGHSDCPQVADVSPQGQVSGRSPQSSGSFRLSSSSRHHPSR